MGRIAIGVDVGGHGVKGVLVDECAGVVGRVSLPLTPQERAREATEARIAAVVEALGAGGDGAPVGVGFPGFFDRRAGVVRASPNFPAWIDVPLSDLLAARLGRPAVVENDANCAVLGEAWRGAAAGARDVAMLTLGTGVGTGFLVDGRLVRGVRGAAAEGGHLTIHPGGRPCGCGRKGCLEAYCSGPGLLATARDAHAARPFGPAPDDPRDVVAAAGAGVPWALAALHRFASDLADGLTPIVHLLSPEAIVLGGGVAAAFPLVAPAIEDALRARAIPACLDGVLPLRRAALGGDAGAVGAAWLALGGGA